MTLPSTETRQHCNTVKIETEYGAIFIHISTDRPCLVTGLRIATPQKLENTALWKFIEQLRYEGEP